MENKLIDLYVYHEIDFKHGWLQTLPKHPVIYPIRNNYQSRKCDELMIKKNSKLLTYLQGYTHGRLNIEIHILLIEYYLLKHKKKRLQTIKKQIHGFDPIHRNVMR